jgi:hypothetical protein
MLHYTTLYWSKLSDIGVMRVAPLVSSALLSSADQGRDV